MKRVFSVVLAIVLVASFSPAAFAQESHPEVDLGLTTSSQPVETQASSSSSIKGRDVTLADGTYYLQSKISGTYVVDVARGSTANGGNVWEYHYNGTPAQRWEITHDSQGFYTIKSVHSGLYLSISGKASAGSNVVQRRYKASDKLQKWALARKGSAYVFTSAANTKIALDVSGAKAEDQTNIQVWKSNGTPAQSFWPILVRPDISSEKTLETGVYIFHPLTNGKVAMDLSGASFGNGANVQLYANNGTQAQKWSVVWNKGGYYKVYNLASGKALAIAGSNPCARANVVQGKPSNSLAQRWAIKASGNGYKFVSLLNGKAIDMAGGQTKSKTNLRMHNSSGADAQKFTAKPVRLLRGGYYQIFTGLSADSLAVDVPNGKSTAGLQLGIWKNNGSNAQRYAIRHLGKNVYKIQNVASGRYLVDSKGKVVQTAKSNSKRQQWQATASGGFIRLVNVGTGRMLAVSEGKAGAKLITAEESNGNASAFRFRLLDGAIANGTYVVRTPSGMALDITDASYRSGANVQVYASNGNKAQKWAVTSLGGGSYKLVSPYSFKALDVADGSSADGANVQQCTWNGTRAQAWKIDLDDDGYLVFTSQASGKVLTAASGGKKSNGNVYQKTNKRTSGQKWKMKAVSGYSLSGNGELDQIVAGVLSGLTTGGDQLREAFDYVAYSYRYINGSKNPTGDWSPGFAIEMYRNGGGNCYRFAALFTWLARGLGYAANAIAGGVPSVSQGIAPHGWTEIYINGKTYVCDPDMANAISSRNWYMFTYDNAPTNYIF